MSLLKTGEEPLVAGEAITAQRDYTFDEDAILGKFSEEDILEEDLMEQAANQIVRRMAAVVK